MDNKLTFGLTYGTAIGAGLMAGLFFTFSVFMMRALDKLPPPQGIAAMQSINKVIITPLFMLVFMGTSAACAVLGGLAVFKLDGPKRWWVLAGALLYLIGVLMLTGGYHVPKNDALDAVDPNSAEGARLWVDYVKNWTALNHLRTLSSIGALGSFIMAIRVG